MNLSKLICDIFGHKPKITDTIIKLYDGTETHNAQCTRCKCRMFGTTSTGHLTGLPITSFIKL